MCDKNSPGEMNGTTDAIPITWIEEQANNPKNAGMYAMALRKVVREWRTHECNREATQTQPY